MKKKFRNLSVSILLALSFGLAACGGGGHETISSQNWSEWTLVAAPTCADEGVEMRVSTSDSSVVETRSVPVRHNWGEWEMLNAPTCTAAGIDERVCTDCQNSDLRAIPALGHDWGNWENMIASCTDTGVEMRICKNDDNHTDIRTSSALGHDWTEWDASSPATCTTDGVEMRLCRNNNNHKETYSVPALGHDWTDWVVVSHPAGNIDGAEMRLCKNNKAHAETRAIYAGVGSGFYEGVGKSEGFAHELISNPAELARFFDRYLLESEANGILLTRLKITYDDSYFKAKQLLLMRYTVYSPYIEPVSFALDKNVYTITNNTLTTYIDCFPNNSSATGPDIQITHWLAVIDLDTKYAQDTVLKVSFSAELFDKLFNRGENLFQDFPEPIAAILEEGKLTEALKQQYAGYITPYNAEYSDIKYIVSVGDYISEVRSDGTVQFVSRYINFSYENEIQQIRRHYRPLYGINGDYLGCYLYSAYLNLNIDMGDGGKALCEVYAHYEPEIGKLQIWNGETFKHETLDCRSFARITVDWNNAYSKGDGGMFNSIYLITTKSGIWDLENVWNEYKELALTKNEWRHPDNYSQQKVIVF